MLRAPPARAGVRVAAWIGSACWFTPSTSFANPAAAFGRMFSDSFGSIAPGDVPAFVAAQFAGAGLAMLADRALGAPGER